MKRVLDIVLVVVTAPVTVPLFLMTMLSVRLILGSPVFFLQERAGLNGRPFRMIKFRSMLTTSGESGELLPDAQRLTAFGRLLRRFSLDELPELLHVLSGRMSLVGPRPLPVRYVPRYNSGQARRLLCRPGITGWAQVNGRNSLDWEERFAHDVWYVDNRSLLLDLKILVLTIVTVFRSEGISADNHATMNEFTGTEPTPSGTAGDLQR